MRPISHWETQWVAAVQIEPPPGRPPVDDPGELPGDDSVVPRVGEGRRVRSRAARVPRTGSDPATGRRRGGSTWGYIV